MSREKLAQVSITGEALLSLIKHRLIEVDNLSPRLKGLVEVTSIHVDGIRDIVTVKFKGDNGGGVYEGGDFPSCGFITKADLMLD